MKKAKIWAGLLGLTLIFGLTACGTSSKEEKADEKTVTEEAAGSETESETEKDYSTLVTDAYMESVDFSDFSYVYQVPEIHLDSPDGAAVNAEIRQAADAYLEEAKNDADRGDFTTNCGGIKYEWYVNNDILSVVVITYLYPEASGYDAYTVYNLNLSDGSRMTAEAVYEAAGYTEENFKKAVQEAAGSYYWDMYEPVFANGGMSRDDSFVQDRFAFTISEENIAGSQPFFNGDGNLSVAVDIGALAGGSKYPNLVDIENYEISEYYVQYNPN